MLNNFVISFCIVYTSISIGIHLVDYIIKILEEKNGKNN